MRQLTEMKIFTLRLNIQTNKLIMERWIFYLHSAILERNLDPRQTQRIISYTPLGLSTKLFWTIGKHHFIWPSSFLRVYGKLKCLKIIGNFPTIRRNRLQIVYLFLELFISAFTNSAKGSSCSTFNWNCFWMEQ